MGNSNHKDKNRREFLFAFLSGKKNTPGENTGKPEMVKMLTAEGKLVEIDKAVLDAAAKNQKATNKEIYSWMKNPSKENS